MARSDHGDRHAGGLRVTAHSTGRRADLAHLPRRRRHRHRQPVPRGERSAGVLVDAGLFQGRAELRRRNWDAVPRRPGAPSTRSCSPTPTSTTAATCRGWSGRASPDRSAARRRPPSSPRSCCATAPTSRRRTRAYANEAGLLQAPTRAAAVRRRRRRARDRRCSSRWSSTSDATIAGGITLRAAPGRAHPRLGVRRRSTVDGHRVLFSGDLGRAGPPAAAAPGRPAGLRHVVVESTYGDRRAPGAGPRRLADVDHGARSRRGGSVLMPAFAVDRTELVLLRAARGSRETAGSPTCRSTSTARWRSPRCGSTARRSPGHDPQRARRPVGRTSDLFDPGDLRAGPHAARSPSGSTTRRVPASSSRRPAWPPAAGCCTTCAQHAARTRATPSCSPASRCAGTRGRQLLDGARHVKIHGRYVPVRAEVVSLDGFSAHADAGELVAWLGRPAARRGPAYVVHGEPDAAAALADRHPRRPRLERRRAPLRRAGPAGLTAPGRPGTFSSGPSRSPAAEW